MECPGRGRVITFILAFIVPYILLALFFQRKYMGVYNYYEEERLLPPGYDYINLLMPSKATTSIL